MSGNDEQIEYWNSPSGEKWVAFQEQLDRLFTEITALLFERAASGEGERVLDVGCGAGQTSLMHGRRVGVSGAVLGADISRPLLAKANAARDTAGAANVSFIEADAQAHDFGAPSFDLVASRFGVMFFDDPASAFANLRSALKPVGRCVFVCWDGAKANPWFKLPRDVAVARLGEPSAISPRDPGPMAFADTDYVRDFLTRAGFANIDITTHDLRLHHAAGAVGAAELASQVGPASRILREFSGTQGDVRAIADGVATAFREYETPDGIRVPARIHAVEARG